VFAAQNCTKTQQRDVSKGNIKKMLAVVATVSCEIPCTCLALQINSSDLFAFSTILITLMNMGLNLISSRISLTLRMIADFKDYLTCK